MNQETRKSAIFNAMAVILIVIFCINLTPITFQNDTFYTIKIGEYITEHGVTMQEPFAWHENLKYTFPHWAYDVCIYLIYSVGGLAGIYISTFILASILGLLMYYTNVKLVRNRSISFIITIATLYLMKDFICARAQLVTFILFILTIYFIENFLKTKKIRYAIGLIIIPILIANLHVATFYFYFILYLPYLAEYAFYVLESCNVIICGSIIESIKKKIAKNGETEELALKLQTEEARYNKIKQKLDQKLENPYKIKINYNTNIKWLLIIMIICIFSGFLTPLGDVPYTYFIKTMQGISTKNISEHLPVILANNYKLFTVLVVYIGIIAFTKIKVRLSDLFMFLGLTFLAINSRRQASMLYLIGCFIANRMITEIFIEYYKEEGLKKLEDTLSSVLSIIIITASIITCSLLLYKEKMNNIYIDEQHYPVQAAEWIKNNLNLEEIKLYNEYNYGSYLLYKGIPVFVDSRCDLYMPEFNDNVYVFKDFLDINGMNIDNVEEKLNEYGFTHFILIRGNKLKNYIKSKPDKYKKIYPINGIIDPYFTIYEKI